MSTLTSKSFEAENSFLNCRPFGFQFSKDLGNVTWPSWTAERGTFALADGRRRGKRLHGGSLVIGDELPDPGSGGVRIEPDFSGVDLANTFDEQFGRGLLQNNSAGPQLHRLNELILIVGCGPENHARLVFRGPQLL